MLLAAVAVSEKLAGENALTHTHTHTYKQRRGGVGKSSYIQHYKNLNMREQIF